MNGEVPEGIEQNQNNKTTLEIPPKDKSNEGSNARVERLGKTQEIIGRLEKQDEKFKGTLDAALGPYARALEDLSRICPDLGDELETIRALELLVERPPLEIAKRVLYWAAVQVYRSKVKRFYGSEVTSALGNMAEEKRDVRAQCDRECSGWVANLLLKYGPEEATTMAETKCMMRKASYSDKDLNLIVERLVDTYPDIFKTVLGAEGKEMYYHGPKPVLRNFLVYGKYKLREYFAHHLENWKGVLKPHEDIVSPTLSSPEARNNP